MADPGALGLGTTVGHHARIAEDVTTGRRTAVAESVAIGRGSALGADVVVDATAFLGKDVRIGDGARIGRGAFIGDRVRVDAGADVGHGALIGHGCIIEAGAQVSPGADVPAGKVVRAVPRTASQPAPVHHEEPRALEALPLAPGRGVSEVHLVVWARDQSPRLFEQIIALRHDIAGMNREQIPNLEVWDSAQQELDALLAEVANLRAHELL